MESYNQSLVTAAVVLIDGILPRAQGQEASLGRHVGQCMGQPVLCSAGAMSSFPCEGSHFDSIHFRDIKSCPKYMSSFP